MPLRHQQVHQPIIISPTCGFANRLRVMLSYYELARHLKNRLVVYWPLTSACNGYFWDFFQPVPYLEFTTNQPLYINYHGGKLHPNFQQPSYRHLRLRPKFQRFIDAYIAQNKLNEKPHIALHIRRTDHTTLSKDRNKPVTTDDEFIAFVKEQPTDAKIYLATDNRKTQDQFINLFGKDRVLVHHLINPINTAQRKTSLGEAIFDIYICSQTHKFKGSHRSSFSDLISLLRKINQGKDLPSTFTPQSQQNKIDA